ncbi:hypothetical protein M8C21_024431 [Ambrosia artemisiifolia]|uniref:Uncharacterized protein n=1 Tax=Ambrosia artemisiifolia TaxID=4212 RepID=A0AAD5CFG1_AMBAR|nr:hypothetical protein M8C21_024431 [Ambrosia artemisiifolia]
MPPLGASEHSLWEENVQHDVNMVADAEKLWTAQCSYIQVSDPPSDDTDGHNNGGCSNMNVDENVNEIEDGEIVGEDNQNVAQAPEPEIGAAPEQSQRSEGESSMSQSLHGGVKETCMGNYSKEKDLVGPSGIYEGVLNLDRAHVSNGPTAVITPPPPSRKRQRGIFESDVGSGQALRNSVHNFWACSNGPELNNPNPHELKVNFLIGASTATVADPVPRLAPPDNIPSENSSSHRFQSGVPFSDTIAPTAVDPITGLPVGATAEVPAVDPIASPAVDPITVLPDVEKKSGVATGDQRTAGV